MLRARRYSMPDFRPQCVRMFVCTQMVLNLYTEYLNGLLWLELGKTSTFPYEKKHRLLVQAR